MDSVSTSATGSGRAERERPSAGSNVSIFDASLHQLYEKQDGRPLAELFDHNVRQARDLLA